MSKIPSFLNVGDGFCQHFVERDTCSLCNTPAVIRSIYVVIGYNGNGGEGTVLFTGSHAQLAEWYCSPETDDLLTRFTHIERIER